MNTTLIFKVGEQLITTMQAEHLATVPDLGHDVVIRNKRYEVVGIEHDLNQGYITIRLETHD